MSTKIQNLKWKLFKDKEKKLHVYGLENGLIIPYNEELIEKLRNVYYGGMPASVILLSDGMTNGNCYDRALLLSRAFLDTEDDINLIYATVDSIRLNPEFISNDPLYADHCFLERITKDGQHVIYDTSNGFIYDKELYWKLEHPKVRKINDKKSIKEFVSSDLVRYPEDIGNDKYLALLVIPAIESTYGKSTEMYAQPGIEMLQREIELYKEAINYDALNEEINQNLRNKGSKV